MVSHRCVGRQARLLASLRRAFAGGHHRIPPPGVEPGEAGSVHRAVRGRMLREEVYGDDGSPHALRLLLVKEYSHTVHGVTANERPRQRQRHQRHPRRVSPRAFSDDLSTELECAWPSSFLLTIVEDPLSNSARVKMDEICLLPSETTHLMPRGPRRRLFTTSALCRPVR